MSKEKELENKILELENEISHLKSRKKYGLVWDEEKVPEKVVQECETKFPVLKVKEGKKFKEIINDKSKPTNILIEGDNYHALSVLNYTHKGKIDVIYIDPPYNTGNKDFIYNDSFVDKEDSYRHSKWLSFMEKRLKLAKDLLKDSGAIFISIDDNEQPQLKILCDSIFGENNFVECIVWDKKSSAKGVPPKNMIVNVHEYVMVYQKNEYFSFVGQERTEVSGKFKNPDNDTRGPWRESNIKSTIKSLDKAFTITNPKTNKEYTNTWAFSKESLEQMIQEGRILWKEKLPKQKEFMYEMRNENMAIKSNWGVFDPQSTTVFLKELLPEVKFDNPKPINLMKYLVSVATKKDDVILDFMSGSGTTGHAVLELNKEDGGNRQFIMVTNNENKICEEVTFERISRVMNGYKNKKGEEVEGLGGNLKYLECDFVDRTKHTDNMKLRLTRACTEILCLKEGVFEVVKEEKEGGNLMYKIFSGSKLNKNTGKVEAHTFGIYFDIDDSYLEDMRADLKNTEGTKSAYIFTLNSGQDIIDDHRKWKGIEVEEIPQKILEIYEEIYNRNNKRIK